MTRKFAIILFAGLVCGLSSFSVAKANGKSSSSPLESEYLIQKGESLFLHYCAHCHGVQGEGDGYNADYLDKEPAELSDHKFISKKTNDQLFRVISLGGQGVHKSHLMPVFGKTLSDEEIWSLVAYVRFLARDDQHSVSLPSGVNTIRPQLNPVTPEFIKSFRKWYELHGQDAAVIARGKKLFEKKKSCFACHQIDEEGGMVGPDLSRAGFYYTPEWLFTWIRDPQFVKPETKMPTIGLEEDEDRAVTAYLATLKGEGIPEEWQVYLKVPGDPEKGRALFFDPEGKAYCAKCHQVREKGGKVGPSLTYVGTTRTPEFLLESILEPKAVITVGYSSVLILTKLGKFITGVKVNEDDSSIDLIGKDGEKQHILKKDIKKFKTQKISIMPGNFKDILTIEEIRNLLAFLESLKLPELDDSERKMDVSLVHH